MEVDILSDQAYQEDVLNFGKYTNILSHIIVHTPTVPFAMGIFGEWGCGKTTLMRMIQERVSRRCKTMWFNAWKYDDKQNLPRALLKTIHDEAIESMDLADDILEENIRRAGDFTGQKLTAKRLSTMFFEVSKLDPAYIKLMEDTTQTVMRQFLGKEGRLVLFIDDLDRCLPEHAITVLETIKLHCEEIPCVIVLGAVRDVLESVVQQHYPGKDISGADYIEKMLQITFTIPHPESIRLRQYLYKQTLPTGEKLQDVKGIAEMLLIGSGFNMRKLKRLVNQLKLIAEVAEMKSAKTMQVAILTKLLVLQMRFPEFYDAVKKRPDVIYRYHQVLSTKDEDVQKKIFQELPILEASDKDPTFVDFFKKSAQVTCHDLNEVNQLIHLAEIVR